MRKSILVFLLVLTLILLGILGIFIGTQFRSRLFKPKFRLSEGISPKSKTTKKEFLDIKVNLMSSICKNLRGNVKGKIPDSLELDISQTKDDEGKSFTKILDTGHVDIKGMKGFTHILKEKLPVSKYKYGNIEQKGLMTDTPLDAVFIYFREDKLNEPPVMVCPVVSIDDRDFDCYLRDSDNNWSQMESLMELDLGDDNFGDKLGEMIEEHYREKPKKQPKEDRPEPKVQYPKLILDISKKGEFSNDLLKVSEIEKIKVGGFVGYNHKFAKKTMVSKYEHKGVEQSGLPTEEPLDSVLTYFSIEKLNQLPLMVCPVTSESKMKFQCYLRDSDDVWFKSEQIGKLRVRDSKFGEKVSQIVDKHYSLRTRSTTVQSEDLDRSEAEIGTKKEELTENEQEYRHEEKQEQKTEPVLEPEVVKETEEQKPDVVEEPDLEETQEPESDEEDETEEVKTIECLDIFKHKAEEFDLYKVEEIEELSMEGYKTFGNFFNDPSIVDCYKSGENQQSGLPTGVKLEGVVTMFRQDMLEKGPLVVCTVTSMDDMEFQCYLKDSDDRWSKNETLSEIDLMDQDEQQNAVELVNNHYNLENAETKVEEPESNVVEEPELVEETEEQRPDAVETKEERKTEDQTQENDS